MVPQVESSAESANRQAFQQAKHASTLLHLLSLAVSAARKILNELEEAFKELRQAKPNLPAETPPRGPDTIPPCPRLASEVDMPYHALPLDAHCYCYSAVLPI